jgi:hypothetical protein
MSKKLSAMVTRNPSIYESDLNNFHGLKEIKLVNKKTSFHVSKFDSSSDLGSVQGKTKKA